ncbi:MAG TPA: pantoate--beta-alanine ligase [Bacillales bacterium]|nr:pantoate--beta-alanine ligase [Bacillales bacterium]
MEIIQSIREMQQFVLNKKQKGNTVGFVPTMGSLHEGHMSLVERAVEENDVTIMSIFVNPLQFSPGEDFDQYPRDFEKDERTAGNAGIDVIFYPDTEEMYPGEPAVTVSVDKRTEVLCGKSRPGHFDGVATVLTKLFHITIPDRVYFGMKDAQQIAVVESLIQDFNFPVTLVACPTVREADGLAKSSRNVYLTEAERKEAAALHESLQRGAELYRGGERDTECLREEVLAVLNDRLTKAKIEYVEVLTYPSLKFVERCDGRMIIALAVHFGAARLIDNITLGGEAQTTSFETSDRLLSEIK